MASINTRSTKRAKITRELPDVLFRHILSFALPPRGKTEHKRKMRTVFTDITTLNLYNPVENVFTVDGFTMYDDPRIVTMEQYLRQPAVLQTALGGELNFDPTESFWQYDVRFQTTWQTRRTMAKMLAEDEDMGEGDGESYDRPMRWWSFYNRIQKITL